MQNNNIGVNLMELGRILRTGALLAFILASCVVTPKVEHDVANGMARFSEAYERISGAPLPGRDGEVVAEILARLESRYVNVVQTEQLIDAAISGMESLPEDERHGGRFAAAAIDAMLETLDPYTRYMPPREYSSYMDTLDGHFVGFGVYLRVQDGKLTVINPMPGSPAAEAGVRTGDRITHINGESLLDLKLQEAVTKIRGPVGTQAVLTIERPGEATPLTYEITRRDIALQTVNHRIDGDVGYIRIASFNRTTAQDFSRSLDEIEARAGARLCGLVIDVRDNPGGLAWEALHIADQFLADGDIIAVTNRGRDSWRLAADESDRLQGRPIVVMLNKDSASSAELLAGALRYHKRASLFGETSFGKGTMQTLIGLESGGGLRITTGEIMAGGAQAFNGMGLTPDVRDETRNGEPWDAAVHRAEQSMGCASAVTAARE